MNPSNQLIDCIESIVYDYVAAHRQCPQCGIWDVSPLEVRPRPAAKNGASRAHQQRTLAQPLRHIKHSNTTDSHLVISSAALQQSRFGLCVAAARP
ncbi:MAG: hypothetical protein ACK41V_08770 [Acidovorax sp.]